MALVPSNKQWTQTNDGDSNGVLNATWNTDLKENRGALKVSKPLKNVFDETDDVDLENPVAKFLEYGSDIWAISNELFKVATTAGNDITDTANWSQDSTGSSPDPAASVTDAVVFNGLLLVQDGTDIKSYNGSTWSSWWNAFANTSPLQLGEKFVMTVAADGDLYITDGGNTVNRVRTTGNPLLAADGDTGTLDLSATPYKITCGAATSSRLFYGTEDEEGENCAIIEWDMGSQSLTANRIHKMGAKRVFCIAVWNDTPIAILSDGSIKYHNGSAFVDWPNARLPKTANKYQTDIVHKNGWAIIDDLPHFLINPTIDIDENTITEDSSQLWNYPAGIYCLDPQIGFYCRYAIAGNKPVSADMGALFARSHKNTKFFASYDDWTTTTTKKSVIACEDSTNASESTAWAIFQPFESVAQVIKKITAIHSKLESGDSLTAYYSRSNIETAKVSGVWNDTATFHTTEAITGIENGDVGIIKAGVSAGELVVVKTATTGTTVNVVEVSTPLGVTLNDASIIEFTNFRFMGSANAGVEMTDLSIPDAKKTRQVWLWLVLKQAAGNNVQLDYLLTE